jgi:hypothetical protein
MARSSDDDDDDDDDDDSDEDDSDDDDSDSDDDDDDDDSDDSDDDSDDEDDSELPDETNSMRWYRSWAKHPDGRAAERKRADTTAATAPAHIGRRRRRAAVRPYVGRPP